MRVLFLSLMCFIAWGCQAQSVKLFPIVEDNRIGYINQHGKVIIAPLYYAGGEFSEGLAPVRTAGLYGYIDAQGTLVIPPQFDYALPFNEGFAIAYKDGAPYYIDQSGKIPFPAPYKELGYFLNGRAQVITHTGKYGYINTSGKLFIDTAYKYIQEFSEGMVVVHRMDSKGSKNKDRGNVAVVDSLGRFVVPFDRFDRIGSFKNGYALVEIEENKGDETGETAQSGFINTNGEVVLLRPNKNNTWIDGEISEALAKITLYKHWLPEEKGVLYSSDKSYEGYISLTGDIVLNDTTIETVYSFQNGRAFVQDKERRYYLIDTVGKKVTPNYYDRVLNTSFKGGIAFVQVNGLWGAIDRNGNMVIEPQFQEIDYEGLINGYFFFGADNPDDSSSYETLYGIANGKGQVILKPILEEFSHSGYVDGLLKARIGGGLVYLDTTGTVVWQQPKSKPGPPTNLNIDFMNRGYFYAAPPQRDTTYSGHGFSRNTPEKLESPVGTRQLLVVVDTTERKVYEEMFNGYTLKVVNGTGKPITFNAQDSRLDLKIQAKDAKGKWRDIEYTPNSWCGNSYHTMDLPAGHQWVFTVPVYEGAFSTQLRAVLQYVDPKGKSKKGWKRKELTIYSNEFSGSVNPGQFWRKPDYHPAGLMDPYYE